MAQYLHRHSGRPLVCNLGFPCPLDGRITEVIREAGWYWLPLYIPHQAAHHEKSPTTQGIED